MQPILKAENLTKNYTRKRLAGPREEVRALDGVSFSISSGTTLAIVGESGSGKSTLALCVACLENPTSGTIWFDGVDITKLEEKERRAIRQQVQLVFQDPASSFNPRWNVLEILTEPMLLIGSLNRNEMTLRAHSLLAQVGLSPEMEARSSGELSGGQRQRLAVARALTLNPKLLILDEALSALDCSVQAQIANLLVDLQSDLDMTYLFITHDLAMAAHLGDEIAVMNHGRIVEQGPPHKILKQPQRETTRGLLASVSRLSFGQRQTPEP